MGKMCLSIDLAQGLCELSHVKSELRNILWRKTSSRTPMRMPTRLRARYRKGVVKAARNRSFHPEKLCCATFDRATHRVGSAGRSKKMLPAPPTFISPRHRDCGTQKLTTGFNELVKHVFLPAREISGW